MPSRLLISIAVLGNVVVAATTFALLGWNAPAAHAAARYTAWFSSLWFTAGFAALGFVRFVPAWSSKVALTGRGTIVPARGTGAEDPPAAALPPALAQTGQTEAGQKEAGQKSAALKTARLIHAFLGAHLVHFASVSLLLAAFESAHVLEHPARALLVIVIGFAVVVTAGLTATPRVSRPYTVLHKIMLYAVFLIFFADFAFNRVKPLRLAALVLGLALLLRLTTGLTYWTAGVKPAD